MKLKSLAICVLAAFAVIGTCNLQAKKLSDLRIYINPGHGGYDSDDRNIPVYPYATHDTLGYWESKSNLYKGLHMYHMLRDLGATAFLSRVKNTSADDRDLYDISSECNSLNCDIFISIHSNAGESVNFPLMLYREDLVGAAGGPTKPRYPENVTLSQIMFKHTISNRLPVWTSEKEYIAGDIVFYRPSGWGDSGLGVLRRLYTVGLLSEGSMHQHVPQAYRLLNDDYLWLEAWLLVRSIMEFAETETFTTGNIAGVIYDDQNLREHDLPAVPLYSRFGRDRNMPVRSCRIELQDMDGKVIQERVTDLLYNGVFVFRDLQPGNYRIKVDDPRYYPYTKEVTVVANDVVYNDVPLTDKCEYPLEILTYSPKVDGDTKVSCSTTIDFTFNTSINTEAWEKAVTIEPAVDGYWTYANSFRSATFTPELAFTKDTEYTVTVGTGACTSNDRYENNHLQEPLKFTFGTASRNRVTVTGHYPTDGGTLHFNAPTVEFRFDNAIDKASATKAFTITDSKGNAVKLNSRNIKANTVTNNYGNINYSISGDLTVGEEYTVNLETSMVDKENLPLDQTVNFKFTAIDATKEMDPDMKLRLDFENSCDFAYDPEATTGTGTTTPKSDRNTSKKIAGEASAMFNYTFTSTHDGKITWLYNGDTDNFQFNAGDRIGMYIFGDYNGHELQVAMKSGTAVSYHKLCDLDFMGWQYKELSLDDLQAEYAPYTFAGFRIIQANDPAALKGTFYVDNLSTLSSVDAGVSDITADNNTVSVTADNGAITVSNASDDDIVRIFAADGRVIRAFRGNRTKAVAPGAYVVTVGNRSFKVSVL